MKYDTWTTKDGRQINVVLMSDLHLMHTICALANGGLYTPFADDACKERDNWLTVFRGEAVKRGLDLNVAPTRRVGLFDFVFQQLEKDGWPCACHSLREHAKATLSFHRIPQPEIDVSNLDGKPSYLHWQTGDGVGTPLAN